MRIIDADAFIEDTQKLYSEAGWDEREVHFSLADIKANIDSQKAIMTEYEYKYLKDLATEISRKVEEKMLYELRNLIRPGL